MVDNSFVIGRNKHGDGTYRLGFCRGQKQIGSADRRYIVIADKRVNQVIGTSK